VAIGGIGERNAVLYSDYCLAINEVINPIPRLSSLGLENLGEAMLSLWVFLEPRIHVFSKPFNSYIIEKL